MTQTNYAGYQEPTLRETIAVAEKLGCGLSVRAGRVLLAPRDDGVSNSWIWEEGG